MAQMFIRDLKKVSTLWSGRFRVSALERFCYKGFLKNSSGKTFFVRVREVSTLEDVRFGQVPLYVPNRNIGKSGRLISDIIEITSTQQVEGFLIKMDVEKDFDSLDHKFLISVLKKFEFG